MHPVLRAAVDDATDAFGADSVNFTERSDGSVKVTVSALDIGDGWEPQTVAITTVLLGTFPSPPPYPFYLPAGLRKTDSGSIANLTSATLDGVDMAQLSVRPKGNRPTDSFPALIRAVVSWLRDH